MNAELVLFGRRIDMAQRRRRRILVVGIYAALAVIMLVFWFLTHWRGTGVYVLWAAMLVCRLFLGGYYKGGLVKPFQPPRIPKQDAPPPLLALQLRVYQPVLQADEDGWRNDERELHQRDRAHYLAYQWMGAAMVLPWFLATLRLLRASFLSGLAMTPDEMYYGLTLISVTLFLTLPQAILLWTEPDMEPL